MRFACQRLLLDDVAQLAPLENQGPRNRRELGHQPLLDVRHVCPHDRMFRQVARQAVSERQDAHADALIRRQRQVRQRTVDGGQRLGHWRPRRVDHEPRHIALLRLDEPELENAVRRNGLVHEEQPIRLEQRAEADACRLRHEPRCRQRLFRQHAVDLLPLDQLDAVAPGQLDLKQVRQSTAWCRLPLRDHRQPRGRGGGRHGGKRGHQDRDRRQKAPRLP